MAEFSKSSRKWMLTFNNPADHGYTHDRIKEKLKDEFSNLVYFCMCDEEGSESHTYHTHLYFVTSSGNQWERIERIFHGANRVAPYGKSSECRAYVLKDGEKFHKDASGHYHYIDAKQQVHDGINYSDTFEEFGDLPEEHQGASSSSSLVVSLIRSGASNRDIVDAVPSSYKDLEKIERTRSMFRDAEFADKWRDMTVSYLFGKTGSGKTRSIMETYGYLNVYRVTDYKHPFDTYDGQDVLVFEEFRGGLKHGDMLNYLDGYPLLLPCRYFNRQACYTKVYIISNIPPDHQYSGIDDESKQAFYRRIHKVVEFSANGKQYEYNGVNAYLHRYDWTQDSFSLPRGSKDPF